MKEPYVKQEVVQFLIFHYRQKQAWNVSECESKFYFVVLLIPTKWFNKDI